MTEVEVVLDGSDGPEPGGDPAPETSRAALGMLLAVLLVALVALIWVGPGDRADSAPPSTEHAQPSLNDPFASSTAVLGSSAEVESTEPVVTGAPEPVLGEAVGLELWFGGDTNLTRLDLDSGELLSLPFNSYPILGSGQFLIAFRTDRNAFVAIDRGDPTAEPSPVSDDPDFEIEMIAPGQLAGTVWIVRQADDSTFDWRLMSLTNRIALRTTTTTSVTTSSVAFGIPVAIGPELDARDDGLYALTESGFEFWLNGRVVVRNSERALIEICASVDDCSIAWYDLRTLESIAVPTPIDLLPHTELLGEGSWIHERSEDASVSQLVEVFTSRTFDTTLRVRGRQFDVSPDGRWAGITGGQRLRIMNLTSGDLTLVPQAANRVGTSSSVVFLRVVR